MAAHHVGEHASIFEGEDKSYARRLALGLVLMVITAVALSADRQLNVLFVAFDDLRPQLGCYGNKQIKSPTIDKLANEGLSSTAPIASWRCATLPAPRCFPAADPRPWTFSDRHLRSRCPAPRCIHSAPALQRGTAIVRSASGRSSMQPTAIMTTLCRGVRTAAASTTPTTAAAPAMKKPKAKRRRQRTQRRSACERNALRRTRLHRRRPGRWQGGASAVAALREIKNQPFFLAVGFHKPHLPFVAPKKYWDLYDSSKIDLASNSFLPKNAPEFASNDASELRRYRGVPKKGPVPDDDARRLIHGYYACTSYVDAQLAKVIAELDRLGLRDNTVIIMWGDHGYHLGEHGTWNKRTNWEIATRVPMIISVPGQKAKGVKTDALVEFVDIYPVLWSCAGCRCRASWKAQVSSNCCRIRSALEARRFQHLSEGDTGTGHGLWPRHADRSLPVYRVECTGERHANKRGSMIIGATRTKTRMLPKCPRTKNWSSNWHSN